MGMHPAAEDKTAPLQPRGLHTAEVPNREPCGEHLTEHSRDGGAHHAPAEAENEERV